MDDRGLGLIAVIVIAVVGLVAVVGAIAGGFYLSDSPIGATIIDKSCGTNPIGKTSEVTVRTVFPVPGITHTLEDFDNRICSGLRTGDDGNFAEYYLKSGRTILYEREGGLCLYDSDGLLC